MGERGERWTSWESSPTGEEGAADVDAAKTRVRSEEVAWERYGDVMSRAGAMHVHM
jgi:hypothetical protein